MSAPPFSASATAPATRRARRGVPRAINLSWLVRWISPLAILLLWQLASSTGLLSPRDLAAPTTILTAAWDLVQNGQLPDALLVSLRRAALGLAVGTAFAVLLGAIAGLSKTGDAIVDPPLQMLRTLPLFGLIPLFILWFGIGELPKVLLVALGVSFPLYLNTFSAIRQVDPKLFETARVLGFTFWQRIRNIVIPSAAPQILVGLRQSLAIAWLTLIVAEQINANSGIGFLINNARDFLRIDIIIFGLVVYALLGITTDWIVRVLERRAARYRS
jgi:sulfonate transport system permease protein